jgi:hypothetical protein
LILHLSLFGPGQFATSSFQSIFPPSLVPGVVG